PDSERVSPHVRTRLEALGEPTDTQLAKAVHDAGRELSEANSRVNFLLSDGTTLFAYHDGHKTLHLLEKHASDLVEIGMADADYRVSLRLGDAADERAVVVASVPLTDEP